MEKVLDRMDATADPATDRYLKIAEKRDRIAADYVRRARALLGE